MTMCMEGLWNWLRIYTQRLQLWEPQFPPLCLYLLCTFATLIQWATFLFLIFCFVTQNHFSHLQEFSPPHNAFFVINFLTFIPTCLLTGSCHILSRILALFTWSKREMQLACLNQNYKHYISFWCNNK